MRCAVGFADVSGFTSLSQQVELAELSRLLSAFENVGSEIVREHGGRVVTFLGDAVMLVTADLSPDGDCFGTPVNLASRLTGAAQPGELRVDAAVAAALEPGRAVELQPIALRGFTEPVSPWRVGP